MKAQQWFDLEKPLIIHVKHKYNTSLVSPFRPWIGTTNITGFEDFDQSADSLYRILVRTLRQLTT